MKGIYAYFIIGALLSTITAVLVGYVKGEQHGVEQGEIKMQQHLVADRKAEDGAKEHVRQLEHSLADAQAQVAESYEKGKQDAEVQAQRVIDDLRAGNVRLRQHWSGCKAEHLPGATATTAQLNAGTADREESAARIVRAAMECDVQVRGLQDLLRLEREQLNKQ